MGDIERKDIDIIRRIKRDFRQTGFNDKISIRTISGDGTTWYSADDIDDFAKEMFDLSLTSRILCCSTTIWKAKVDEYGLYIRKLSSSSSRDCHCHQTNITPRLIEFLTWILNPERRMKLAKALDESPSIVKENIIVSNDDADHMPVILPEKSSDLWDWFENMDGDFF